MKRKILSLALVLMMVISMIPMGAFAATGTSGPADRDTTSFSVDKTSVTADNSSTAEFTFYTYDNNGKITGNEGVTIVSSRSTDKFVTGSTVAAKYTTVTTDAFGKGTIKLKSSAAGTSKIGLFVGSPDTTKAIKLLNGTSDSASGITAIDLGLVGTKDVTFTADNASSAKTSFSLTAYDKKDGTALATSDGATVTPIGSGSAPKANNVEHWKMEVRVLTSGEAAVAGETVEFSANNSCISFDTEKVTTDGSGVATVKIYSTKSGTYTITTKVAGTNIEKKVTFLSSGITSLELKTDNNASVANETRKKIKLKLMDSNSNQFKVNDTESFKEALKNVNVEVVTEPNGSDLKSDVTGSYTSNAGKGIGTYGFDYDADNLLLRVTPKKEGDYALRIYLNNGKKVEYKFKAIKQGAIVALDFYYDEVNVPYNFTANSMTLDQLDANKVNKAANLSDIDFSSSDVSVATVDNVDQLAGDPDSRGTVRFTNDDVNIGKEVTITATDRNNKVSKSYTFKVAGKLSSLKAEAPASNEAGKDASVAVKFVDNKGNVVSFATSATISAEGFVLEKPAGATVSTEASSTFDGDMKNLGAASFFVGSNKEGAVKLNIIVTFTEGTNVTQKMSSIVTVNFGPAGTVVSGGKGIILTIGNKVGITNGTPSSMDLAPFIKDGRAFVPVRFISEALGAKVEFTKTAAGLTDTVILTQGTTVVTMKINATDIKVVKAGVETKVASDAAATIKDGRTVLPFRALADALGAKATYGMKADNSGVEWVKFEQ